MPTTLTPPASRQATAPCAAHWTALGTTASVFVTDPAALTRARAIVTGELEAIDLACSRFRADSELEHVNRRAPRAVAASELLLEAVEVGLRGVHASDGDVDPALGEALILAGYDRDFELLEPPADPDTGPGGPRELRAGGSPTPSRAEVLTTAAQTTEERTTAAPQDSPARSRNPERMRIRARRVAGWRTIEVDREHATVRVGRGVRLDLGATAKALAADRAALAASAATGAGVLVNLGGDLAVSGLPPAGGWPVFVTDDHRNSLDDPGQLVQIQTGGLATSSVTRRRWLKDGEPRHHIIDPRTGGQADSCWRTVSVAAASCVDANIASTAALVRGEAALQWLADAELPARLVTHAGEVHTVAGWPKEASASSEAQNPSGGPAR